MNLIDIVRRKDRALVGSPPGLEPCTHECEGFRMSALRLPVDCVIRLREFHRFDSMRALPRELGWAVAVDPRSRTKQPITFSVTVASGSGRPPVEVATRQAGFDAARWHSVRFDWPVDVKEAEDPELTIQVSQHAGAAAPDAAIFLGVSELTDIRKPLLAYARGTGVEVGPGTSPQVRPGPGVDVKYIERSSIDHWMALYKKNRPEDLPAELRSLWKHYLQGDARTLDGIPDASLDFIFSSHVFEHLVNPLGTLACWHAKLRCGGHVIGIVPDANNCFDLRQPLSRESDWLMERESEISSYQPYHYEKWCRFTEPRTTVESLRERDYSVHAHYYTPVTCARLLELAREHLRYRNFHIRSTRNHKDFGWLLQK